MDPDARRVQLLSAARAVFARSGYHRTGVGDIVAECGVARGTFYRYFDSKRAIFDRVLEQMMDEVVGVVVPIDVSTPIAEQVFANLDRLIRAITAQDVCRVLFSEALGLDEEGDVVLRDFYRDALERIEAALQTGQQLGVVRQGDVTLLARCLLGLLKEPVVQGSLEGQDVDAEALVPELVRLMRSGLLV